ncbi:unnamed protein product [Vitrella brassicaformis CCMP3155]|uniref:USP domain-containing protein n=1 Tax=Vitrella brassicaformis (strain CCMP3155) TaxID=1169540 RepID=A0A0G4GM13_VITBC|nr:unnamed protein product [Vitrella brassicaformis CCMP3155]|eukprot:CEM31173.1 unnamed protein product [Vitrella brassicaformis CCMP3155]
MDAAMAGVDDEEQQQIQRAIEESLKDGQQIEKQLRKLVRLADGCYFNCLLQVLFHVTPVFKGALYQIGAHSQTRGGGGSGALLTSPYLSDKGEDVECPLLYCLRDLFVLLECTVDDIVDASYLYKKLFGPDSIAAMASGSVGSYLQEDASEQRDQLLKAILSPQHTQTQTQTTKDVTSSISNFDEVCRRLFSGRLIEWFADGDRRETPLDFCQLDLHLPGDEGDTTNKHPSPRTLDEALEMHLNDLHGNVQRKEYDLAPVVWVNLDRFAYDRSSGRGVKVTHPMHFPAILSTRRLLPCDAPWMEKINDADRKHHALQKKLEVNQLYLAELQSDSHDMRRHESKILSLVQEQEDLIEQVSEALSALRALEDEQELLYYLQAVIVHDGSCEGGHYWTFVRENQGSPASDQWIRIDDSKVERCSFVRVQMESFGDPNLTPEQCAQLTQTLAPNDALLASPSPLSAAANKSQRRMLPSTTASSHPDDPSPSPPPAAAAASSGSYRIGGSAYCLIYVRSSQHRQSIQLLRSVRECIPPHCMKAIDEKNFAIMHDKVEQVVECTMSLQQSLFSPTSLSSIPQPAGALSPQMRPSDGGGITDMDWTVVEDQNQMDTSDSEKSDPAIHMPHRGSTTAGGIGKSHEDATMMECLHAVAQLIRAERNLAVARLFILRYAWYLTFPYLPEHHPHYGRALKDMLLKALIRRGQAEISQLVAEGPNASIFPAHIHVRPAAGVGVGGKRGAASHPQQPSSLEHIFGEYDVQLAKIMQKAAERRGGG